MNKVKEPIKSQRNIVFTAAVLILFSLATLFYFTSIKEVQSTQDFIKPGVFTIVLLANALFFSSEMKSMSFSDDSMTIKHLITGRKTVLPYSEIKRYSNSGIIVFLFKAKSGKVFAIRRFEFENFGEMRNCIIGNSIEIAIKATSNYKKGFVSYLLAFIIVFTGFILHMNAV